MTIPSPEEIRLASEAITRDGQMAPATMELSVLVVTDPILKETLDRMTRAITSLDILHDDLGLMSFVASCIVTGLNYGLRIAEHREQKKQ